MTKIVQSRVSSHRPKDNLYLARANTQKFRNLPYERLTIVNIGRLIDFPWLYINEDERKVGRTEADDTLHGYIHTIVWSMVSSENPRLSKTK